MVVSEQLMPTIVSLLVKDVGSFTCEEVPSREGEVPPPRTRHTPLEDDPTRWKTGKIMLEALREGELSITQIGLVLEAQDYKSTSASPLTTKLVRSGHIVRVGEGRYALATKN